METPFFEVASLEVDSHHGIYSAQYLAQKYPASCFEGLSVEDHAVLLAGPDHEDYIEVMDHLEECEVRDENYKKWAICWIDGDIYFYPADIEIDWSETQY